MHRFFSSPQNISENKITLCDKNLVHHIKNVLRLKIGARVIIFDGQGYEYTCLIKKLSDRIILGIHKTSQPLTMNHEPSTKLTIACAMPKKSKMDDIIDKLTQLGVDKIIPLKTERVIVRLDKNKITARLKRWERIALGAGEQSKRNRLPMVSAVKELKEVLDNSGEHDLKLIPTLQGRRRPLKEALDEKKARNILVFIGPEGDFSPREVELARKTGCIPVTLGDLVLRVETAAVAVASFIRLYEKY